MKPYASPARFVLMLIAASLLLLPGMLSAQSLTSGDISGTVTDPTGAAVPNATVGPLFSVETDAFVRLAKVKPSHLPTPGDLHHTLL